MDPNYSEEKSTKIEKSINITCTIKGKSTSVEIDIRSIRLSKLLSNLLEEFKNEEELNISEIDGETLKIIAEYLNHYAEKEPKEVSKPLVRYEIDFLYGTWEKKFIYKFKEKYQIWRILEAANYLGISSLLDLGSSYVACLIRDYSSKEILDYFELEEDMTEQEVEQMEEEYRKKLIDEKEEQMDREKRLRELNNAYLDEEI